MRKILILSGISWSDTIQRHQRMAEYLSKNECEVIFLENIVSSKFSFKKALQKMRNILKKNKKLFSQDTKVKIIKTFFLNPHGLFKSYNHILVKKVLKNIGNEFDTIINYLPIDTTDYLINKSKYNILIYDCVRDFENWGGYHKSIKNQEKILLSNSNHILVDSFYLKEKLIAKVGNEEKITQIFPTITLEELNIYRRYYNRELKTIKSISYFGTVDNHIDIELLNKLSEEYIINIIGKIDKNVKISKNIKIYEFTNNLGELARLLLKISDAIIIPYCKNMNGVIPAKLIQALSTGLPVYVSSFYDAEILKDKLYVYKDYKSLNDLILEFDEKEFCSRKIKYKKFIEDKIEEKQFEKVLRKILEEESLD